MTVRDDGYHSPYAGPEQERTLPAVCPRCGQSVAFPLFYALAPCRACGGTVRRPNLNAPRV